MTRDAGTRAPVFIVGTGRCGSTVLDRIVDRHPNAVVVSEFFSFVTDLGMRIDRAFPAEPIAGVDFWRLLSEPQPRQCTLLEHGLQMDEVTYRSERTRFGSTTLPPISHATLPNLEPDDPDRLFDELARTVDRFPRQPAADHYRDLFDTIAERAGKSIWVERSGGGLRLVARLRSCFPDARFIHIVRDGRAVATSMSGHIGFRMAILCALIHEGLGVDPYESDDRTYEHDLTDDLVDLLPEHFSSEAFNDFELPPDLCAHYWTGEIRAGLSELDDLEPDRLLTIRYEDLVAAPVETCRSIGLFVAGEADDDWLRAADAMIDIRPSKVDGLPQSVRDHLAEACRPGFDALAGAGIEYRP